MTKYEFHTALLCLALIVAGVLGYQFVNGDDGESTGYWSDIFNQTEAMEQRQGSRIEIHPPDYYNKKTGHDKPTLREQSRFQEITINYDLQIVPGDDKSRPDDLEPAVGEQDAEDESQKPSAGL